MILGETHMKPEAEKSEAREGQTNRPRFLNVSGVPFHAWQRARANALASDMPFRDYVIKLLEESQPVLHQK
jgi:hypothetical protein